MRQCAAAAANFQSDMVRPVGIRLVGVSNPDPRPQLKSVWRPTRLYERMTSTTFGAGETSSHTQLPSRVVPVVQP
jgi:hypothetical protein